jgi:hypothetical protein
MINRGTDIDSNAPRATKKVVLDCLSYERNRYEQYESTTTLDFLCEMGTKAVSPSRRQ